MYRNYDGNGSAFGDIGVQSVSSDQSSLSIYGAQRSSDNSVTVMVINKTAQDLTTTVAVTGTLPTTTAQVYTYSSANLSQIVQSADLKGTASGVSATFPANSITLLVWPTPNLAHRIGFPLLGDL
jgi:hypothetical protein